ncbi:hypothetical protein M0813_27734 [Anaeramoeba flamelloides]|uniref:Uncharacterized protein n=1 Tax=Anaeramoeba flamelloides TaxID=1746091 RepID=A0ABQ8XUS1_9EUKA|nr:hypothetical protein M0813_27734 [Anaeramoeba flamelloides]
MSITFPDQTELLKDLEGRTKILSKLCSQVLATKQEKEIKRLGQYLHELYPKEGISSKLLALTGARQLKDTSLYERVLNSEESKLLLGKFSKNIVKIVRQTHEYEIIKQAVVKLPVKFNKVLIQQIRYYNLKPCAELIFETVKEHLGEHESSKILPLVSNETLQKNESTLDYCLKKMSSNILKILIEFHYEQVDEYFVKKLKTIDKNVVANFFYNYTAFLQELSKHSAKLFINFCSKHLPRDQIFRFFSSYSLFLVKKEPELLFKFLMRPEFIKKGKSDWYHVQGSLLGKFVRFFNDSQIEEIASLVSNYGSKSDCAKFLKYLPPKKALEIFEKCFADLKNKNLKAHELKKLPRTIRFALAKKIYFSPRIQNKPRNDQKMLILQEADIAEVRELLMNNFQSNEIYDRKKAYEYLLNCTFKSGNGEEITKTLNLVKQRIRNDENAVKTVVFETIYERLRIQFLTQEDLEVLVGIFSDFFNSKDQSRSVHTHIINTIVKILNYHFNILRSGIEKKKKQLLENEELKGKHQKWIDAMTKLLMSCANKDQSLPLNYRIRKSLSQRTLLYLFLNLYPVIHSNLKKGKFDTLFDIFDWKQGFLKKNKQLMEKDLPEIILKNNRFPSVNRLITEWLRDKDKRKSRINQIIETIDDPTYYFIPSVFNYIVKNRQDLLAKMDIFQNNGIIDGEYINFTANIINLKQLDLQMDIEEVEGEGREETKKEKDQGFILFTNKRSLRFLDTNLQRKYLESLKEVIFREEKLEEGEKSFFETHYLGLIQTVGYLPVFDIEIYQNLLEREKKNTIIIETILQNLIILDANFDKTIQIILKYLNSNKARIAMYVVDSISKNISKEKMVQFIESLLNRKSLKITVKKQLIRLIRDIDQHKCMKVMEKIWNQKNVQKDVRITILNTCILSLNKFEKAWELLNEGIRFKGEDNKAIQSWFSTLPVYNIPFDVLERFLELIMVLIQTTEHSSVLADSYRLIENNVFKIRKEEIKKKLFQMLRENFTSIETWSQWKYSATILAKLAEASEKGCSYLLDVLTQLVNKNDNQIINKSQQPDALLTRDNPIYQRLKYVLKRISQIDKKTVITKYQLIEKIFQLIDEQYFPFFFDEYIELQFFFSPNNPESRLKVLLDIESKIKKFHLELEYYNYANSCRNCFSFYSKKQKTKYSTLAKQLSERDSVFLKLESILILKSLQLWNEQNIKLLVQFRNDENLLIKKIALSTFTFSEQYGVFQK